MVTPSRGSRVRRGSTAIVAAFAVGLALAVAACQGAPRAEPTVDATPNAEEAVLLGGLRRDAFADCAPIRSGLPDGAVAGIECFPGLVDVDRVALFLFDFRPTLLETLLRAPGRSRSPAAIGLLPGGHWR